MQRYRLLAIGSIVTIILDQITKVWAVRALSIPDGTLPEFARQIRTQTIVVFESWFNFRLTGNKGAAWGIFGNLPDGWRVPFFVVIGVVAIAVIIGIYRSSDGQNLVRWALTLVLGGAIGLSLIHISEPTRPY